MRKEQEKFKDDSKSKEINLREYYLLIKKSFWIVIVITIFSTLAGYYYSTLNNIQLYQTSTRMIINTDSESMKTLMVMVKDSIIMEKVGEELQLNKSPEGIASQVSVSRINDSQVVSISVIDSDPTRAANIANTTATVFKSEINKILNFNGLQLLSEAEVNDRPIDNNTQNRTIMIAFVFGMVVSIGLVFLLDTLDGAIRKEKEVEEILGVPVLGVVSNMNKKKHVTRKVKQQQNDIELRGETVGIK